MNSSEVHDAFVPCVLVCLSSMFLFEVKDVLVLLLKIKCAYKIIKKIIKIYDT